MKKYPTKNAIKKHKKMQPLDKSAKKCKQNANKNAIERKMRKNPNKKCKFWNCAFLHFWEGLRSSRIETTPKTRGKLKTFFAFLWGPPVRAPKVQKIGKTRGKCKNNAKKIRKKCKLWNCACFAKKSRSCVFLRFCLHLCCCFFLHFPGARFLGLNFLGALFFAF